ncbi:MAG: hypothetical protein WD467_01855 [Candidatus Saccharimonadales bacterium]
MTTRVFESSNLVEPVHAAASAEHWGEAREVRLARLTAMEAKADAKQHEEARQHVQYPAGRIAIRHTTE